MHALTRLMILCVPASSGPALHILTRKAVKRVAGAGVTERRPRVEEFPRRVGTPAKTTFFAGRMVSLRASSLRKFPTEIFAH
jgi:hypothetical protein